MLNYPSVSKPTAYITRCFIDFGSSPDQRAKVDGNDVGASMLSANPKN